MNYQETDENPFRNSSKINPNAISHEILNLCHGGIIFMNDVFYIYKEGVYRATSDIVIGKMIKDIVGDKFSIHLFKEVKNSLAAETWWNPELLDQVSTFLNVQNGILDLDKLTLMSHTEPYISINQLNTKYEPNASCPKWESFLSEVLGDDPSKITIIQEFIGYSLCRHTHQEKALMLIGDGANGKSVILNVLESLFGSENVSTVPMEQFKNPNYLAEFFGRMVNISTETNTKTTVYESTFKQLVSGEVIAAERKFCHPFKFRNTCKLIFAFNQYPRIEDRTDAFYRRILPIQFNKQIPEAKQNKNLTEQLKNEKSGILNWCLKGYHRLLTHRIFSDSESVRQSKIDYLKENNNYVGFIEECCVVASVLSIPKNTLYSAYSDYCDENGYKPLGKSRFGKLLKKYLPDISEDRSSESRLWIGIGLRPVTQLVTQMTK